jgi:hypothetical protein
VIPRVRADVWIVRGLLIGFASIVGATLVVIFLPIADCPGSSSLLPPLRSEKMKRWHRKCPDCLGTGKVTLGKRWTTPVPTSFPDDGAILAAFRLKSSPSELVRFEELRSSRAESERDEALHMVLSKLSPAELETVGIRVSGMVGGDYWVVAYSEDSAEAQDALVRALRRVGITDCPGSTSLGETGWSVRKGDFVRARRCLLEDHQCQIEGVCVLPVRLEIRN